MPYTQNDFRKYARWFRRPHSGHIPGGRRNLDLGWWGGVTWVHNVTITNASLADIEMNVTPGADNELVLQSMDVLKIGANSAIIVYQIEDGSDNVLDVLYVLISLAANAHAMWPQLHQAGGTSPAGDQGSFPGRRFLSGDMVLNYDVRQVLAGQGANLSCVARVRGNKPTVTYEPSDATVVINTDAFF